MTLRAFVDDLDTANIRSVIRDSKNGDLTQDDIMTHYKINSYANSVDTIVSTLGDVLTPEVNAAIHTYAEKIFVKPFNRVINSQK